MPRDPDTLRAKLAETIAATDDQIISAVRTGGRTNHIADRLGMLRRRPYILRRLLRLEARGLVRRHPAYTFGNSIYWEAIADAVIARIHGEGLSFVDRSAP